MDTVALPDPAALETAQPLLDLSYPGGPLLGAINLGADMIPDLESGQYEPQSTSRADGPGTVLHG